MRTLRRLYSPLAVLAVAVVVPASSAVAATAAAPRTITVQGTGIVKTTPTVADFTFGVAANGATASAALSANAAKMNKVISALKGRGIAAGDIQTAQISLQPNRNQAGDKILNYTATNSVAARVRSIAKAGPVVDAAVSAGANEISGPSLTVTDQLLLSRRALKAAVVDARGRAQAIASAAGVSLGPIQSVSEESTSSPLPLGAVADAKAASTPVSAGTVAIQADVTVVYSIK
jgi:uncharacterized protein